MQIMFHAQNLELSPGIREYIEKKLNHLSRYFEHITSVEVHTSSQRGFKTVEVTLDAKGHLIRAEERSTDLHATVDLVVDKLETQLKHFKEVVVDRSRRPHRHGTMTAEGRSRSSVLEVPSMAAGEEQAEPPKIIRRKRFSLETMDAEEAADRMQMLGHDFFMFLNVESEQINVVYERKDGGFGVLEPESVG